MNEDAKYHKCTDTRGRAIRGLWTRRGLYYAQLQLPGKGCRRVPLLDEEKRHVTTVPKAVIARSALLAGMAKGNLPGPMITPLFRDYVGKYINFLESTSAKSPLTVKKERCCLNNLIKSLGEIRLNQITRTHLNDYAVQRAKEVSNRSINLDIISLRHLLNHAKSEGVLRNGLPTDDWKDLKYVAPKRTLIADDAIERLCAEATAMVKDDDGKSWPKYENGVFLSDYIKLLAYSGARRMAGLRARWVDVDWGNRQLTLRTKFDRSVIVDFNEKLEAHLKDLFERRTEKNSPWIFPSPRPGEGDGCFENPHKIFGLVREAAGFPNTNLHDFRHFFVSFCVMSGVDTLTIARWCGHQDGGVLIGKIYGHLNAAHTQASAKKLKFGNVRNAHAVQQPTTTLRDPNSLSTSELLELLRQKTEQALDKAA